MFTAYLQNTSLNVADSLSKILYVELCNSSKQTVQSIILEISENTALGDFTLADSLEGHYFLRAYTQYMRNFGEETFFTKSLVIGEKFGNNTKINQNISTNQATNSVSNSKITAQYSLKFYPEGGDLVNNLRSNIAFELSGNFDKTKVVQGILRTLTGKTLQTIETMHEGRGIFKHTPLQNEEYDVKFVFVNGDSVVAKLPKAQQIGFLLAASEVNDSIKIKVYGNYLENKKFYLIGQQEGDVFCEAEGNLQKGAYTIAVAKQNLSQGIAQITLFDETGKPHCERLIFINQQNFLNVVIETNKKNYKSKDKVEAELTVTDKSGKAVEGFFSVSVTDAALVKHDKFSENINSYFSLSSELEKYTSQPNYYLQNNSDAKKHLDLLLLTNGWRRYKWKDILDNPMPKPNYPVEQGFYLSGTITNENGKRTLDNSSVTALVNGKPYITETDSIGKFDLAIGTWQDSAKVLIQARNKKGNQYVKLNLDKKENAPIEQLPFSLYPLQNSWNGSDMKNLAEKSRQAQALESNFRMTNNTVTLATVTVVEKRTPEQIIEEKIRGMSLHRNYAKKIEFKNIIPGAYQNPLDALESRVPGLSFVRGEFGKITSIINNRSGEIKVFLLDGVPVPLDVFVGFPTYNIERIEVMTGIEVIYGSPTGAIAVFTKTGTGQSLTALENPGLSQKMMAGFYQAKEFYMPNYDDKNLQLNTPDVRVTVYWNGKIKTDKKGKANFQFFCAENGKQYDLKVEGKAKNNSLTGVGLSKIVVQ